MKSGVLKKGNHERCIRIFYDAAKIIYYRQERLGKSQLKPKEVSAALLLADFYHSSMFRFESSGPLACNFGECSEGKAVAYFGNSVMGTITDLLGREIQIEETGFCAPYTKNTRRASMKLPQRTMNQFGANAFRG